MSSTVFVADRSDTESIAAFSVLARAEPGVIPRVSELFAKRGLVPLLWQGAVSGPQLTIEIKIGGLGQDTIDYVARCMRQIVGVEAVLTTTG